MERGATAVRSASFAKHWIFGAMCLWKDGCSTKPLMRAASLSSGPEERGGMPNLRGLPWNSIAGLAPAPDRRLIINADDFGLSSAVNVAVERAYHEGVLRSASLMTGE